MPATAAGRDGCRLAEVRRVRRSGLRLDAQGGGGRGVDDEVRASDTTSSVPIPAHVIVGRPRPVHAGEAVVERLVAPRRPRDRRGCPRRPCGTGGAASNCSSAEAPSITRRNHGCQPSVAGIDVPSPSAWTSSSSRRLVGVRLARCTAWPGNGQRSPRSHVHSSAAAAGVHGRSHTVPWMAWVSKLTGTAYDSPAYVKRP